MPDTFARLSESLAGRYVVERELGQGGMATVFLARDLRHDRRVALKMLRPELAAVIGVERFLAEIRTTANLQHPHILPLHDSGEADGTVFYVMPYVEGESLRERLKRETHLPIDEAIRLTREIASALDYAHRHQVIHRDIKPENILLHDGQALVADFGIALAVSRSDGGTRMTETGMSLGTPHYMAPEQAMGEREITPRADIYALGAVLYEMLTGEPPFSGVSAQAIVARVLTETPRGLTAQRHTIPPNVEAAVFTALEKLPADRFATAGEFAAALVDPTRTMTTSVAATRVDWRARAAIPALAVGGVALVVAAWALLRPKPPLPVSRYSIVFPAGQTPAIDRPFAISPDGSRLVYGGPGATPSDAGRLWIKARDRAEAAPLVGTEGATHATFSPDGQWIAFTQGNQLRKIPALGGASALITDSASANTTLAWGDDGTIVYAAIGLAQLRRVRETGGPYEIIFRRESGVIGAPVAVPGGHGVLFTDCAGLCTAMALKFGSNDTTRLAPALAAAYAMTGHALLLRTDGALLALPFDATRMKPAGTPVPVMDSVSYLGGPVPLVALSREGTLVVRTGVQSAALGQYRLVYIDRRGLETPLDSSWTFRLTQFGGNAGWALSPDGTRLAVGMNTDAGDHIWIKQLPRGPLSRLTFDSGADYRPRWARDGGSVRFSSQRGGVARIYERSSDGTGTDKLVLQLGPFSIHEAALSPDGQWFAFRAGGTVNQTGGRDIYLVKVGDTVTHPLIATKQFDEASIALSPDGRWIAYESNETGRTEVYLRPFPNVEAGKWQVSTDGGSAPVWSRDGKELYFVSRVRDMTVVPVVSGSAPKLGERRVLFHMGDQFYLTRNENYTPFDVTADGRFIMARRIQAANADATSTIVVENWFEELRKRLGK